jgi:hypothetical protein
MILSTSDKIDGRCEITITAIPLAFAAFKAPAKV